MGGFTLLLLTFFFPMRCYFEFRIKLNFEIYLFESNSSAFSFPIGLVGFCGSKEKAFLTFFCSIHFPLSSQAKDESHKHAMCAQVKEKIFLTLFHSIHFTLTFQAKDELRVHTHTQCVLFGLNPNCFTGETRRSARKSSAYGSEFSEELPV